MPKQPRERVPYYAIVDRPKLTLPGNARLAVWVIVNIENWEIRRPMPRMVLPPPLGVPLLPDLPNWAWHEYGMRVGFWRFLECLTQRKIMPTLALNGSVCQQYPRVCEAALAAGWEFMGHGFVQMPMHNLEDQRGAIRRTIEAITTFTGRPPRGWESPASPKLSIPPTSWLRKASNTSPIGFLTINRARSQPNPVRSFRCLTRWK